MPSATSTIGGCAPGATRTDVLCAAWRIGCWPCCAPCCVRERCLMPASVIEPCALQPNLAPLPQGAARRKGTHPSKNLDRMVGSPSPLFFVNVDSRRFTVPVTLLEATLALLTSWMSEPMPQAVEVIGKTEQQSLADLDGQAAPGSARGELALNG